MWTIAGQQQPIRVEEHHLVELAWRDLSEAPSVTVAYGVPRERLMALAVVASPDMNIRVAQGGLAHETSPPIGRPLVDTAEAEARRSEWFPRVVARLSFGLAACKRATLGRGRRRSTDR